MNLISVLLTLLVACLILYLIYWILTALVHADPRFVQIVMIILVIAVLMYLIGALIGNAPIIRIGAGAVSALALMIAPGAKMGEP